MDNPYPPSATIKSKLQLKLLPDELLTSYLTRLSHLHGMAASSFIKALWSKSAFLNQDIDRAFPKQLLQDLEEIFGMSGYGSLGDKIKWIRNKSKHNYQEPNLLDLCIRGTVRQKFGQQYCSECLKECCYYKRSWRLATYPVCLKHQYLLLNKCPYCKQSINPLLVNPMLKNIGYCWSCWKNLRVSSLYIGSAKPKLLDAMHESINTGWFKFEGLKMRSYLFMNGFWRIIYSLYGTRSQKKQLWEKLCQYFEIPFQQLNYSRPYNNFKDESPAMRLKIITLVECLIRNWPKTFVETSKAIGMTISHLDPMKKGIPFWLDSIAKKYLNKSWYRVNIDEVRSCLEYMRKYNIKITRMGLARELGLEESKKLNINERELFERFKRGL